MFGPGQGGGLDILTQELGKFWLDATDHPGYSYILPQESDGNLLDVTVFFFAPTDCISSSTNDTMLGVTRLWRLLQQWNSILSNSK